MARLASELKEWLETLDSSAEIAIDEGGLALIEVGGNAYIEVGGEEVDHFSL